jgi:hypothetical protein
MTQRSPFFMIRLTAPPLPKELQEFAKLEGSWNPPLLSKLVKNAAGHRIRVDFKSLSSTNAGFAALAMGDGNWKMRIAIHKGLNGPSRFGVLCHELAHILLGHLGTDRDHWWPGRQNLNRSVVEIEAEAVAHIVSVHVGLKGTSAAYVSRHLKKGEVPSGVSLDYVGKVADHIKEMATRKCRLAGLDQCLKRSLA